MIEMSLDWIEVTLHTFSIDVALEWFGFNSVDFEHRTGKYGYRLMLHHKEENVYFLLDGRDDMGIHLSVAGSSVDWFRDWVKMDTVKLIRYFSQCGKFTRIDLACDDVDNVHFTIPAVKVLLHKGAYVGRFREFSEIESYVDSGETLTGETIYCGKRASEMFLRIYNKRLEHNKKLPDDPPETVERIRWELEIKGKSAQAAAELVDKMNDFPMAYHALLTGYLRFIKLDNPRKTRCTVLRKWLDFTDGIPGARLVGSRKILNIDQKKRWMWKAIARSVAEVDAADPDFLDLLVDHGKTLL